MHNTCDHVAYAAVAANFLILIPRGIITHLHGPLPYLVRHFQIIGQQETAHRINDDIVAVELMAGLP